jgi:hypothetical protein
MNEQICPISGKNMTPVFQETIIGKYLVTYYYCQESGILKTEQAYWLDEAYKSAIADTDTGLVQRNLANSKLLEIILQLLFKGEGRFLDVSGGYGLLARLMRDKGFDFYTIDKYCTNLFASHFEPEIGFTAKALCAFEVLEHIEEPIKFLTEIFTKYNCKTLLFSTLTFTDDKIPSKNWWYYSFETGQHITFYQPRTLYCLAKSLGLQYYMINSNMHMITDIKLSNIYKLIFSNHRFQIVYRYFVKRKRQGISKTWEDHLLISNEIKKEQ